jgi:hypothetical protein
MDRIIRKLIDYWEIENVSHSKQISENEIMSFQNENNLVFPSDIVDYFKLLNGSNNEYDNKFFKFYSLSNFKSINDDLKNWNGLPDYSNIINTLNDYKYYFVFADFSFTMFSYAIRLYSENACKNEVLVLCGDEYKIISYSFSEFIDLYLNDSIELQFNKEEF